MSKLKGDLEDAAFFYAYPKEYEMVEEIIKEKKGIYEKNLEEVSKTLREALEKNKIKFRRRVSLLRLRSHLSPC